MTDTPQPDRAETLVVDEHTIYWELFGNGDREVVCLLNGLAMHTPAWHSFLPRLRPDYDVLLWDYPGQGRSTTADVPYFIDRFGTYLLRILDHLEVQKIHLVGISYGGFVALEFARQYLVDGWQVYAACRDPASAYELRRLTESGDDKLRMLAMDVTDPASVEAAAIELDSRLRCATWH